MHEWGIAQAIVDRITAVVKENRLTRVKLVKLNLGKKLGIAKEELLFCIKTISNNKLLAECDFAINEDDSAAAGLEYIEGD